MKALELIVAPRLPARPRSHTGNPFTTVGEMVADCANPSCGYHVWGSRAEVKLALADHHRLYHSTEIGVVLLNQPRQ